MVLRFFILAVFLVMSCADGERDNPYDPGSDNYVPWGSSSSKQSSSSSAVASSSSSSDVFVVPSSSSAQAVAVSCDMNYRTVVIGTQTWMAENLNCDVSGSKCYSDSEANCVMYGRLYDWSTAMKVCPKFWHLPNIDDWDELESYVESRNGCKDCAAGYLKSTMWDGKDKYGFSALPGGYGSGGSFGGSFYNVDYVSRWWSANEHGRDYAYYMGTQNGSNGLYWDDSYKASLYSVRCVKDYSSSEENESSSSSAQVVVSCDMNYKKVVIGTQTWMAENLNCNVSGSKCYGEGGQVGVGSGYGITLSTAEIQANCDKYGRLYDWATAMALPSSCNSSSCSVSAKHRGICPNGWHIPSDDEWTTLTDAVGGTSDAGIKLKSKEGWDDDGNGQDAHGFAALPGGFGDGGGYGEAGKYGGWWSATENDANYAYFRTMYFIAADVHRNYFSYGKSGLHSVRCLQD